MKSLSIVRLFIFIMKVLAAIALLTFIIVNFLISLCMLAVIKIFYKYWYSKPFHILWGSDAFLQYQGSSIFGPEENTSMSYFTIRFNGQPDVFKWRKRFKENIINISKSDDMAKPFAAYKKRIVRKLGYYIWEEDPNFSIENHIRLHPCTYDNNKALTKILSDMLQEPYLKGHSPWEIILIKKQLDYDNSDQEQDDQDEYVMAMRTHHSIADGPLLMATCSMFTDDSMKQRFNGK